MKLLQSIKKRWDKKGSRKRTKKRVIKVIRKKKKTGPSLFKVQTPLPQVQVKTQILVQNEFKEPELKVEVIPHEEKPLVLKPPKPVEGILTRDQFLRPFPELKSSLEGFILDQRSEHTQNAYSKDIKRFVKFLLVRRETNPQDEPLDRILFIQYKDGLIKEELEHTTVDRHLAALRSMMNWFCDEGIIEKNPLDKVRFLNPGRISKTNAFTDEEVKKLLTVPNLHTRVGAQHYAILMVLFYCGLRRSELCGLKTTNIHSEKGVRFFNLRGKGNKERIIPLKTPVWNALKYYFLITGRHPRDDRYLFSALKLTRSKDTQKAFDPSMIFYIVRKYALQAGITKKVSPHSCRATAISNARDHMVSDRAIQEFAGWASPDMITRYDKRKTALDQSAAYMIQYGEKELEGLQVNAEWVEHAENLWNGWDQEPEEKTPSS